MPSANSITFFDNRTTTALESILHLVETAERIDAAVAFLSAGGWRRLRDGLTTFVQRGGNLRLLVRRDGRITSPTALEALRQLPNTQVRLHPDPAFHPKRINFHQGGKLAVLLGSANLTAGGLETNPEDGVILEMDARSPEGRQAAQVFEAWWRESKPVSKADLQRLRAERRRRHQEPVTTPSRRPRSRGGRTVPQPGRRQPDRDTAVRRRAHLRSAQRLFELARAARDPDERRRLVERAEALLTQAEGLMRPKGKR